MSLQICILGIDGSGKSTISASLPAILAAELNISVASVSEDFRLVTNNQDHFAPNFNPYKIPLSLRFAKLFKRIAHKLVNTRILYQVFKVTQMVLQDAGAQKIAQVYKPDMIVNDGNTILCSCGREINYRKKKQERGKMSDCNLTPADLKALFAYLLDNKPIDSNIKQKMPKVDKIKRLKKIIEKIGLKGIWLPDIVLFLDVTPLKALDRIARRSAQQYDCHENIEAMGKARKMYHKTLKALALYSSRCSVYCIQADNMTPGDTINKIVIIMNHRKYKAQETANKAESLLGISKDILNHKTLLTKIFNRKYLYKYLVKKLLRGAWREPFFVLSAYGRKFLKQGYSASVMQDIYDKHKKHYNIMQRIFLEYPLHKAVYDRMQILIRLLNQELEKQLNRSTKINIFSCPSGFAQDILGSIKLAGQKNPQIMRRIRLIASDLDPNNEIEQNLKDKAQIMGIELIFIRGDINSPVTRSLWAKYAPFEIALFVGLSSWLCKASTINHLKWLYKNIKQNGVLLTDAFSAAAYSLSGYYMGFKAHYYEPGVYESIADYCGFNGTNAVVSASRNNINSVLLLKSRLKEKIKCN